MFLTKERHAFIIKKTFSQSAIQVKAQLRFAFPQTSATKSNNLLK